jgi:quinone-modifying oxidoreductase subunit QmoC
VGVLQDRSLKLVPREAVSDGALAPYGGNLATLQACLQCGTCTANCSLVGEQSHFPRQQMNLFQLGQYQRLVADPTVWQCFNCGDCSNRCPSGARPGKLMGAIRQMAVEHFAFPRFMAGVTNRPQRWWWMFAAAAALLLLAIALGGSFWPAAGHVRFASMLPHLTLNLFFFALTGLAVAGLATGVARAWSSYQGEPLRQTSPRLLLRAFWAVAVETMAHRRFSDCDGHRTRSFAHLGMFYGFLGLAGLAGVAALLIAVGGQYPFPALHPLKILGNIAAGLLILGTGYFVRERWISARQGDASTYFDWLLLVNLLLVGITGVLCEMFRYWNVPLAAYPGYFLHLVLVFVLLASLPYSKLAHVCYRIVALTSRQYDLLVEAEAAGRGEDDPVRPGVVLPAGVGIAAVTMVSFTGIGK